MSDELMCRLRSSDAGLCGEDLTKYLPRGVTVADCLAAAARITELSAEVERLRDALEPFAQAENEAREQFSKPTTLAILKRVADYFVEWPHYTAARAALNHEPTP
jgi:hypothetical protein